MKIYCVIIASAVSTDVEVFFFPKGALYFMAFMLGSLKNGGASNKGVMWSPEMMEAQSVDFDESCAEEGDYDVWDAKGLLVLQLAVKNLRG